METGLITNETTEQKNEENTVAVTMTMDLDKDKYEAFRRTIDAQTERDLFSNCMNDHLDEMNGTNPDLMAWYLQEQNERLGNKGKKED